MSFISLTYIAMLVGAKTGPITDAACLLPVLADNAETPKMPRGEYA